VAGGMTGVSRGPAHGTVRGRAKTGVALIETERATGPEGTWEQTTELVEISSAPLDAPLVEAAAGSRALLAPALCEPPPGYPPGLRYWSGGFDLSRPDTVGNRIAVLWEGLRGFASR